MTSQLQKNNKSGLGLEATLVVFYESPNAPRLYSPSARSCSRSR